MIFRFPKNYVLVIQVAVSIVALVYIINKILQFQDWQVFLNQLANQKVAFVFLLLIQLLLSFLNLSLESFKWQLLTSTFNPQKFTGSFLQVISGLQLGMVTPARAGEPLGKALLIGKGNRTKGVLLSFAGSLIQNLVIVFAGIISMLFLEKFNVLNTSLFFSIGKGILKYGFIIPVVVGLIVLGLIRIIRVIWNNPLFKRISLHFQILNKLGLVLILKVFLVTVSRYLMYSFQLWLILDFFGIINSYYEIWLIPLYFTLITFVPTIALADIGVRSSIGLFVFGISGSSYLAIITSIFILWFFNLALPSVSGLFLLRSKK